MLPLCYKEEKGFPNYLVPTYINIILRLIKSLYPVYIPLKIIENEIENPKSSTSLDEVIYL